MPELPEPTIENKFPDCIAMNLHLKADSQTGQLLSFIKRLNPNATQSTPKELDISLSVNFSSEQQIEVPGGKPLGFRGGKVTFGVRRGRLQLDLKNCQLQLDEVTLDRSFKILMELETPQDHDQEDPNGSSTGGEIGYEPIDKTTDSLLPVNQQGAQDGYAFGFIFKAKGNGPLIGSAMTEARLGKLQVLALPCDVRATFSVRAEDIRLTWSKVGLTHNLARNKIAIIERALALRYIRPQLESCSLSEANWRYG